MDLALWLRENCTPDSDLDFRAAFYFGVTKSAAIGVGPHALFTLYNFNKINYVNVLDGSDVLTFQPVLHNLLAPERGTTLKIRMIL